MKKEITIPEDNFTTNKVCVDCMVKTKPVYLNEADVNSILKGIKKKVTGLKIRECPSCKKRWFEIGMRA